jgi:AcrR family transcriptional regulator
LNGHALRAAETKASLIEAAIDMFGDGGFDAVSTRQLADKAKVNLAAIAYHLAARPNCSKRRLAPSPTTAGA